MSKEQSPPDFDQMDFGNPELPISKTIDSLCKNLKKRGGLIQEEAISIIQHQQNELKQYAKGSEILNRDNHRLMKENEKLKERQMIMGAVADEHINDMNGIHKEYGDMVRKLKEEKKELNYRIDALSKMNDKKHKYHKNKCEEIEKLKKENKELFDGYLHYWSGGTEGFGKDNAQEMIGDEWREKLEEAEKMGLLDGTG